MKQKAIASVSGAARQVFLTYLEQFRWKEMAQVLKSTKYFELF
jgi:hypothetical protein